MVNILYYWSAKAIHSTN